MDCSIYVSRKTDGSIARLDIEALEGEDLWTAIGRCFPEACDMMDEKDVVGVDESQYDPAVDEIFDEGEDGGLCQWLQEWTAVAVELDVGVEEQIGEAVGYSTREEAVRRAMDVADEWINRQPCDLAELVVVVRVGGEDAMCFEDGQWEECE